MGDCCHDSCNPNAHFGCNAKKGDLYGPFGFFCLYLDLARSKTLPVILKIGNGLEMVDVIQSSVAMMEKIVVDNGAIPPWHSLNV